MKVLDAVILAVVQGLTEFLPVSSKTHLLFTRHFLKLPVDLFFDVTLHIGSLAAILVYYRKSWLELLRERRGEIPRLALATVPLIVAALLFRKHLAEAYENLTLASAMLLVTAAWLFVAERFSREKEGLLEAPIWKIFLVGLAQACAVLPGISRSGSTIGMGYLAGLKRPDAVRFSFFMGAVAIAAGQIGRMSRAAALEFSFFLSIPTMFAATGYDLLKSVFGRNAAVPTLGLHGWIVLAIGFVVSFIVAYASVTWFMAYVRKRGFAPFAVYRIIVGVLVLVFAAKLA